MNRANPSPTIIYAANRAFALTNSRLPLMRRMRDAGWRVVVATGEDDLSRELTREGFIFERVEFSRGSFAPCKDWVSYRLLCRIYRKHRPELVHHFHAKPVIMGSLAAAKSQGRNPPLIINTITGLGFPFGKRGLARFFAGIGYHLSLRHSAATIFQNPDDLDLFLRKGWVKNDNARLLIGSGVDTERFKPIPNVSSRDSPRVLMVARLLRQKGIQEFIEAAEKVKQNFPQARFQLAGEWQESHPDAYPREKIEHAAQTGTIEFLGFLRQIEAVLPQVDIFLMPSYYREGVPRALLEAASCGLPVIGADVPGTRDVIVDGETGFLVPTRDSQALADRVEELLSDPALCIRLGAASREWVKEHCDLKVVTEKQLDIYRSLLDLGP